MITPRENLLRALNHEVPAWLPVAGHCDPYNRPSRDDMPPELEAALGEVRWRGEATVTLSRYLGLDIMDWYGMPVRITRRRVTVEQHTEGDVTTRRWTTPEGELHETSRACRDSTGAVSSNWTEHPVKSAADLPSLAAIFEDEFIEPDPDGVESVRRRRELIGDDGLVMGTMPGMPLGMLVRVYSGVAALAYMWQDAREDLLDLFAIMERNYMQRLAVGAQTDVDAIVSVDDTSTTAISPAMFEACNVDLTNTRARAAHAAGKHYFHHSCGLIRDLLPIYRETEMDAVHAFTIPPMGDVTVVQGRAALGDRITIIAGLQQLSGPMDDRPAVRASIHRMIDEARPWDHFILNATAYPHRTMEQTRFVVECCREVGGGAG